MSMNIGMDDKARLAAANALKETLADSYAVYQKTHGFHWNVTGPMFHTLHVMFEEQYTEMWQALDELAERVRALGEFAPGSGADFAKLSAIKEATGVSGAEEMLAELVNDHETLIRRARNGMEKISASGDVASEDLLTQRIQIHEKTAWMLRSLIG